MNIKSSSGIQRKQGGFIGNWKKGYGGYKVAQNLAELCSVAWKAEIVSNELGYLTTQC